MSNIIELGDGVVCFVGIDPGSRRPGICLLYYNLTTKQIVRVWARVYNLDRYADRAIHVDYQNHRFLRIKAFKEILGSLFRMNRPSNIASEHPYINPRTPGAVIPLAECLFASEEAVYEYNPYMKLERIDPSSIKNAVGVKGNSGDKTAMTKAIAAIPELSNCIVGNLATMDNNAVDSIAVAYCSLKRALDPSWT